MGLQRAILTSGGIGYGDAWLIAKIAELLGATVNSLTGVRLGFIGLASDASSGAPSNGSLRKVHRLMRAGFSVTEINLRDEEHSIAGKLGEVQVVYVDDGDTDRLAEFVKAKRFGLHFSERADHLVYVGDGAGSVIVGHNTDPFVGGKPGTDLVPYDVWTNFGRVKDAFRMLLSQRSVLQQPAFRLRHGQALEVVPGKLPGIMEMNPKSSEQTAAQPRPAQT